MKKGETFAVLTGDIIKSSKLTGEQRQKTLTGIGQLAGEIASIYQDVQVTGPEIFRGDSWQLLISRSPYALRFACFIRAGLRSRGLADTRIGVGIGGVDMLGDRLGHSDGVAFRLSGRALDELKKSETLACHFDSVSADNESFELLLNASFKYAARFMDDWSKLEAGAVQQALAGKTHLQIAKEWPGGETSQQNVAGALHRAGWAPLHNLVTVFETMSLQ